MAGVFFVGSAVSTNTTALDAFETSQFTRLRDARKLKGSSYPDDTIWGMAASPDGTKLALAMSGSSGLWVYDTTTWAKITLPEPIDGSAEHVAWSPDGSLLAVVCTYEPYLVVFNTSDWSRVTITGAQPAGFPYEVGFSPDGSRLAVAHDTTPFLSVYNTSTWARITLGSNPEGRCDSLSWSPDGTRLALAIPNISPYLNIYNTATWAKVTISGGNPTSGSRVARYSPDGSFLAVGSQYGSTYLTMYNASTLAKITVSNQPGAAIIDMAFTLDSARLIVACDAFTSSQFVQLYQTSGWSKSFLAEEDYPVYNPRSVHVAPAAFLAKRVGSSATSKIKDAAGAAAQRTVRLYNRATGELMASGTSDTNGDFELFTLTNSPVQRVVLDDDAGPVYNDLIDRVTPS